MSLSTWLIIISITCLVSSYRIVLLYPIWYMLCFVRIPVSSYVSLMLVVPLTSFSSVLTRISVRSDLSRWWIYLVCLCGACCSMETISALIFIWKLWYFPSLFFSLEPKSILNIHLYLISNSLNWAFLSRNLMVLCTLIGLLCLLKEAYRDLHSNYVADCLAQIKFMDSFHLVIKLV